jgi:uncharacterized repeat protein (TIGR01451 family)
VTVRRLVVVFLAVMVLAAVGTSFYFDSPTHVANAKRPHSLHTRSVSPVSIPMFFEANQGQTDSRVKFVSRGHGYNLFLTADEAVLELQPSAVSKEPASDVIRMQLAGSNSAARVSGTEPLLGKSNYFIGNDPAKWHRGIPQYARVNYESVYRGVNLTYYGTQRQLEFDFRVAAGADPNQIALNFEGASIRLDAGELVLSTGHGDVRFHAPRIYQSDGDTRRTVAGRFRRLADNKIGFQIGPYDHGRELVIDPVISYSTYLGGSGIESFTQIAVDSGLNMYVAGSTTSSDFPGATPPRPGPPNVFNVFVAKIDPSGSALLYATYLGGTGPDLAAGIAVISGQDGFDPTVAGTTSSNNFPTTVDAFQTSASGTHGFLTKLDANGGLTPGFAYSTYLAGNGVDSVSGLAVDKTQAAFVTGTTTSTNSLSGFPSTANAYQPCPFRPGTTCDITTGPPQFFASKINTTGSGTGSVLYSTYLGGDNPTNAVSQGGGIAVDTSGRMYFTGSTNTLGVAGPNDEPPFPLLNAQQKCLNEAGLKTNCSANPPSTLDAILVKINPKVVGTASLVYSTFLGGGANDFGRAVALDGSTNAYVTGETFSVPWNLASSFQEAYGGAGDAFIAKVTNPSGSSTVYPLSYFTYIGGSGEDIGVGIAVDSVQGAHLTGSTTSPDFPVTDNNNLPPFGGNTDAFVGLISTTSAAGNYLGFLGGDNLDQGTSIALNANLDSSPAFVAGLTQSDNFPSNPTQPPLQASLSGAQDAFVARIGSRSDFLLTPDPPKVSPSPGTVGNQVTFTFVFQNKGPDPASNVVFNGTLPASGATFSSANSSPGGDCQAQSARVTCNIGTVAKGAVATVNVVLIPLAGTTLLTVVPTLSVNSGAFVLFTQGSVQIDDFSIKADPASVTINAGDSTSFVATLAPVPGNSTYAHAISLSKTGLPANSEGKFTLTPVTMSGSTPVTSTLNITTTARPVNGGSLLRGGPLRASWLPVAGLSLLGLGVGFKRRRWIAGTLLGLLTGLILLQVACGSSSSNSGTSGGTPAGTYLVTITGTSGSASHNTRVTLIVN